MLVGVRGILSWGARGFLIQWSWRREEEGGQVGGGRAGRGWERLAGVGRGWERMASKGWQGQGEREAGRGWQRLGEAGKATGEGWRGVWRGKVGSKACVLSVKVAMTFVSRSVWRPEWDFDRFFAIT